MKQIAAKVDALLLCRYSLNIQPRTATNLRN